MNEARFLMAQQRLISLVSMIELPALDEAIRGAELARLAPPPRPLEVLYGEDRVAATLELARLAAAFRRAADPLLERLREPIGIFSDRAGAPKGASHG